MFSLNVGLLSGGKSFPTPNPSLIMLPEISRPQMLPQH